MNAPKENDERKTDGGLLGSGCVPGPVQDIALQPDEPILLGGSTGVVIKSTDSIMANPFPKLESQNTDVTCWAAAMASYLNAAFPDRSTAQDALVAYAKSQTDTTDPEKDPAKKRKWAYADGSLNDKYFRSMAEIHAGSGLNFRGCTGQVLATNAQQEYEWVRNKIEAFQYLLVGEIRTGKYHHCYVLFGTKRIKVGGRYEYHWNIMDPGYNYNGQRKKYVANWCEVSHPPSNGEFGFIWELGRA